MIAYLSLLVFSVFLGTEILAVSTPLAQVTIYRILSLISFPILIIHCLRGYTSYKVSKNRTANITIIMYIFWLIWALISGVWSISFVDWAQAVFLITLGISSIFALYTYVDSISTWKKLVNVVWFGMFLLVIWGLFEIITGNYLFADLSKLDKYSTFYTNPLSRIPVTHFENQNDYATMLLGFLSINIIKSNFNKSRIKLGYQILSIITIFLIYRTESRMILLCAILFLIIYKCLSLKFSLDRNRIIGIIILTILSISILIFIVFFTPVLQVFKDLYFRLETGVNLSGDLIRVNLIRNGLFFLGTTFLLGVGAGNIEVWMNQFNILPVSTITNIHNWWFEILVGYGLIIFILYIIIYFYQIYELRKISYLKRFQERKIVNSLIAFLMVFIFASMTSANNMLIEWHWIYMGLIITYIKLSKDKQ